MCGVAVTLIFIVCPTASARKWTSQSGEVISAKYVRLHSGKVVLLQGRKVVSIPFANFSNEDQKYLRQKLEKEGKGHLLPAIKAAKELKNAEEITEPRTWTDIKGRTIEALFVEIKGNKVLLIKDGKEVSVRLQQLSPADQSYAVKQHIHMQNKRLGKQTSIPPSHNIGSGNQGNGYHGNLPGITPGPTNVTPGHSDSMANAEQKRLQGSMAKNMADLKAANQAENQRQNEEKERAQREQERREEETISQSQPEDEQSLQPTESINEQVPLSPVQNVQSCPNVHQQSPSANPTAPGKKSGFSYTACLNIILGSVGLIVGISCLVRRML